MDPRGPSRPAGAGSPRPGTGDLTAGRVTHEFPGTAEHHTTYLVGVLAQMPGLPTPDRSLLLARHGYLFTAALHEDERRQLHEQSAVKIRFLGRPTLLVSGSPGVELFY